MLKHTMHGHYRGRWLQKWQTIGVEGMPPPPRTLTPVMSGEACRGIHMKGRVVSVTGSCEGPMHLQSEGAAWVVGAQHVNAWHQPGADSTCMLVGKCGMQQYALFRGQEGGGPSAEENGILPPDPSTP